MMKEVIVPVPKESKVELLAKCIAVLKSYLHNGFSEEQYKVYITPLKGVTDKLGSTLHEDNLSLTESECLSVIAVIMLEVRDD